MAADLERLFSSAGLMISSRRNRLEINTIEAIECLKSWYISERDAIVVEEELWESIESRLYMGVEVSLDY